MQHHPECEAKGYFAALLPLLQAVGEACWRLEYDVTHHHHLAVAFLTLIYHTTPKQMLSFVTQTFPSVEDTLHWIRSICNYCNRLAQQLFAKHWLIMYETMIENPNPSPY